MTNELQTKNNLLQLRDSNLIEEGISDLHCRSDRHLADKIRLEYQETHIVTEEHDEKAVVH